MGPVRLQLRRGRRVRGLRSTRGLRGALPLEKTIRQVPPLRKKQGRSQQRAFSSQGICRPDFQMGWIHPGVSCAADGYEWCGVFDRKIRTGESCTGGKPSADGGLCLRDRGRDWIDRDGIQRGCCRRTHLTFRTSLCLHLGNVTVGRNPNVAGHLVPRHADVFLRRCVAERRRTSPPIAKKSSSAEAACASVATAAVTVVEYMTPRSPPPGLSRWFTATPALPRKRR